MAVTHLKTQDVYFISFKGLGVCVGVEDGKLVPIDSGNRMETAEELLNAFIDNLRLFIQSRRYDLRKAEAIRPLISFISEYNDDDERIPKEIAEDIIDSLADSEDRWRHSITEAEDLLLDVTDLMMKFGLSVRPESEEETPQSDALAYDKVQQILAKIQKKF